MTTLTEPQDDGLLFLVPDKMVSVRDTFGVDSDMMVPAFSHRDSHVPDLDEAYRFDPQTTLAICAGFAIRPSSPAPSKISNHFSAVAGSSVVAVR